MKRLLNKIKNFEFPPFSFSKETQDNFGDFSITTYITIVALYRKVDFSYTRSI